MARELKQYAVEVISKHSHGRYGKEFYFGMYLWGFNKKDAEEVGMETLAAMSIDEINSRSVQPIDWDWWTSAWLFKKEHGTSAPIGFELAGEGFCCRAYIEPGNH